MEQVSYRVAALSESSTIAMNTKTKELQAQGIDVINLTVGEPDFYTPQHIKEAAKKAVDDNYSFYTNVAGYPELLEAISKKLKRENNLDYAPNQIIVSNGAKHSLANAILTLINKGDEVIIPAPYWVSYSELVKLAEGTNVIIETEVESDFKITPEQLEKAITSKTKAFLLCSPSNPTGSVYTRDELKALVDVLVKHPNIFIITDEIYEHINFIGGHQSIAQFPEIKERVVLINGVSKSYAMTGYRIGYMAAASWIAKACNKLQGQMTTNASTIAQRAAIAALNGDQSCVEEFRSAFERRRNLVYDAISKIKGIKCSKPAGAFYVFPDVSSFYGKSFEGKVIKNSDDMSMYLLEKAFIATVPGSGFGNDKCIRLSFATSDEKLKLAMNRLKEALEQLK
ncbi:MAG: pyridoxal phosphate-dependent aminotransferase [Bacteroidales bacterium]|nr:pyridoxal phosphate-dependent aminotransferase [Bacteroidales bacterium]